MSKVLVVGGTGFIGRSLCRHFAERDFEVFSLSRRSPDNPLPKVRYLVADVRNNESLRSAFDISDDPSIVRFDFVINCGGTVDHRLFSNGGTEVIDQHFVGVINLLNLLDRSSVKRWVQFGSSDQYGALNAPQRESVREEPFSPYSFAKTAADHFLQMLWRSEGFPAASLRLFLAYGPGQNIQRFIPQIITACLAGREFPTSEGAQIRDFCYVTDVVAAVERCLIRDQSNGEILNLGSGTPGRSIREVIETIRSIIGRGEADFGSVPYRKGENMELVADLSKIRTVLDWEPTVDFDEGILNCINYYRA
ncbi:NAD-dependent epimerase/dehydratase family protein [Brucella intermedia]|uniref:NAD-dependent epimerase/dehydratase family protein n=1 Tax=Brucella intermedia TaxID=94625 RepID=UPI0002D71F9B|nr:NAD-dependent epimerase/dehydratase family protein [Brucella intermedia]SUB12168.1 dTDP-glucose 4,6-dehydratase [Brucella intermedia]